MMRHLICCAFALAIGLAPAGAQTLAISDLMAAAAAGDARAQFELAEKYRIGDGVLQSYARAAEYYSAAADQGHGWAQNSLGALYLTGLGVPADAQQGFELLKAAAATGEPTFLHDLAGAYQNGLGTAPDAAKAAALYQRASELGWVEATVSLGVLYQEGNGVERDIARAAALYTVPATEGHARAQNNLGLLYARGEGVVQDYNVAFDWLSKAAGQGLPTAMSNLGVMYENGFGVARDEDEAKRLYRLAAQGVPGGADRAFEPVFDPRLSAPDPALAESYAAAARVGDPVAQFLLGFLLVSDTDAPQYRQAAALFEAAASRGLPVAMANLGILSFQGKGMLQDYVEGFKWLTLAAAAGYPEAIALRDALATRMTPQQINQANSVAEQYWKTVTAAVK